MSKLKIFDARQEILKYGRSFATSFGAYEILFEPHALGPMVNVRSRTDSDRCGTWLLADCPLEFVVALGAAARRLIEAAK